MHANAASPALLVHRCACQQAKELAHRRSPPEIQLLRSAGYARITYQLHGSLASNWQAVPQHLPCSVQTLTGVNSRVSECLRKAAASPLPVHL
jgi:hypothetical protein